MWQTAKLRAPSSNCGGPKYWIFLLSTTSPPSASGSADFLPFFPAALTLASGFTSAGLVVTVFSSYY